MRLFARRRKAPKTKEQAEIDFWRGVHAREGEFANAQFERFFTAQFGLTRDDYAGRRVLDVGCGPRGSLEWATGIAAECVGVDPLVHDYRELRIDRHRMRYVKAGAERMPFDDGYFDIVSTFNSLDHVDDVDATIRELTRVASPGGIGLVLVEIGHPPTRTEPQSLEWDVLDHFSGWQVRRADRYALAEDHNIYRSWLAAEPWTRDPGLLSAVLVRS